MDWYYATPHLISGYIPVIAVLLLYFFILHVSEIKQKSGHIIMSFVFCFYLVGVLTLTGICLQPSFSPRIVFIPFVDMIKGPVDTALNVLLFMPMGFFISILYRKYDRLSRIALAGFLISLSIEVLQMFFSGSSDINDLMTNTAGACAGFGIYKLLRPVIPESWIEQIQVEGLQCDYELPFFWIGLTVVMFTAQVQIHHTLF